MHPFARPLAQSSMLGTALGDLTPEAQQAAIDSWNKPQQYNWPTAPLPPPPTPVLDPLPGPMPPPQGGGGSPAAGGVFTPIDEAAYNFARACWMAGGVIDEDDVQEAMAKGWGCGRLEQRQDGLYYVLGPNQKRLEADEARKVMERAPLIRACYEAGGIPRAGGACYQVGRNEAGQLGYRIDKPLVVQPVGQGGEKDIMSTGHKIVMVVLAAGALYGVYKAFTLGDPMHPFARPLSAPALTLSCPPNVVGCNQGQVGMHIQQVHHIALGEEPAKEEPCPCTGTKVLFGVGGLVIGAVAGFFLSSDARKERVKSEGRARIAKGKERLKYLAQETASGVRRGARGPQAG